MPYGIRPTIWPIYWILGEYKILLIEQSHKVVGQMREYDMFAHILLKELDLFLMPYILYSNLLVSDLLRTWTTVTIFFFSQKRVLNAVQLRKICFLSVFLLKTLQYSYTISVFLKYLSCRKLVWIWLFAPTSWGGSGFFEGFL